MSDIAFESPVLDIECPECFVENEVSLDGLHDEQRIACLGCGATIIIDFEVRG